MIRSSIAAKQTQHLVPVESSDLTLISNGFDEAIQFHLSNDFVMNAEEDGEVVDIDDSAGFIMVKYKSGKTQAINLTPEVVKNSGGGFYTSNQLRPVLNKIGQKFKKDEVLAYHEKYFKYSKLNGLRYTLGPLVKVAIASSYNTYEDSGICTYSLAEKMKTKIVYQESATFKRNSNIFHMANIGDNVTIGDTLIKYDISFEDNEISKYLSKLSEENKAIFEAETKNEIKTNHAGKIVDIKIYTLQDPSNLSPSLGNIVKTYFDKINNRKNFLEKYDNNPGIIKAGQIIRDSTTPLHTRYNTIKGYKGIDVLIEFYIEHDDVMGVGDKLAVYGANKQIIGELIPKGYEPYSEFRPDEEISALCSPGTLARRMTMSTTTVMAAMKIMLELKRKIKKEIKYK
jgi:DNA-directed RNA polymerase beta subunit